MSCLLCLYICYLYVWLVSNCLVESGLVRAGFAYLGSAVISHVQHVIVSNIIAIALELARNNYTRRRNTHSLLSSGVGLDARFDVTSRMSLGCCIITFCGDKNAPPPLLLPSRVSE